MQIEASPTNREKNTQPSSPSNPPSIQATAPGQIRVIKRNGTVVSYDQSKINVAITKAFLAVEGGNAADSTRIHESVSELSAQISEIFVRRMPSGGTIHIEDIQDQVELALMRTGEHKVARSYVIYRAEHERLRVKQKETTTNDELKIEVTLDNGERANLDTERLKTVIEEACAGLEGVSADTIFNESLKNLYTGVKMADVRTSLVMTARTMVEKDPNYSYVTARLLMDTIRA